MDFWLVDAFAQGPFTGNPAGVCLVEEFPQQDYMQKIANEFNWSQTAFVKSLSADHFHIRWFSPRDEAPICGHATLAASHVIKLTKCSEAKSVSFESQAGMLHAAYNQDGSISLNFPAKPVQEEPLIKSVQEALGNTEVVECCSDGVIYIVRLARFEQLLHIEPDLNLISTLPFRAICVTSPGPDGYDFASRYFAPKVGIPEDPVCGSAHCRLAPYWGEILSKTNLKAFQASRRTGTVLCAVQNNRVELSGHAVTIGSGTLMLS